MVEGPDQQHISSEQIAALDDQSASVRFLFEPSSGSVEYTTRAARKWLTPERRSVLEDLVEETDLEEADPATIRHDGHQFVLDSMYGALGHRLLITVSEATDDRTPAKEVLTDRQLEVAEYAASGATGPEIADALDVETSTIYDHLQKIYDRLDIGSRAELTRFIVGG